MTPLVTDFWLFLAAALMLNLTPGPDTAFVVARSALGGFKAGLLAALGVGAGCFVHIGAAAIGLSALIAASSTAFAIVKLVGAGYLVIIGARMLLQRSDAGADGSSQSQSATIEGTHLRQVFWQGFWTNVLNPKVALFFLAFLPQFIPVGGISPAVSFVCLGLIFNTTGTIWNVVIAYASARTNRAITASARVQQVLTRALGVLFVGLGVKLALSER